MCACLPGNTCNYHTYRNWPQEKKDAFNHRRRLAYKAKKAKKNVSHINESSLSSKNLEIVNNIFSEDFGDDGYSRQKLVAELILEQDAIKNKDKPDSSAFQDEKYDGYSIEDSAVIREWTGNYGSSKEDAEIFDQMVELIERSEDPLAVERTLYRRIDLPQGISSQDEILQWVEENYPIDSEKSLSTNSKAPVSTTTNAEFAIRGNTPGVVFRTATNLGLNHPNYDYEEEVILKPENYKVEGYTWIEGNKLLVDVVPISEKTEEKSASLTPMEAMMGKLPEQASNPTLSRDEISEMMNNTHQRNEERDNQYKAQFAKLNDLMSGSSTPTSGSPQTASGSPEWVDPRNSTETSNALAHEAAASASRMKNLSQNELNILEDYQSHNYARYNYQGSNPEYIASESERKALREVIQKLEAGNEARTLWRGEAPQYGSDDTVESLLGRFNVGEKYEWGSRFISTSAKPEMATRFAGVTSGSGGILIKFENTTKGAAIFDGDDGGEYETLMSDHSSFTVKSKSQELVNGRMQWVVVLGE